ncbi:MAG: TolC family protein [Candidatus Omnitrophota bacterium]
MFELTKNKIKLLKLFYEHPGESFYLQQIGRMIGRKPGVFQRTINGLEKEGLLTSEYKANARFFRANTKSPFYSELRGIVFQYGKLFKKTLGAWLLAALCLLFLSAQAPAEEGPPADEGLSVESAVLMAFENNKNIRIQEKEVEAALAQILGARSYFLPQVNAQGSYTRRGSVPKASAAIASGKDYGVYAGYENDHQWSLLAGQSIYSGGANLANLREKQLGLKVQEETLRALKLDTEFETKRLFYGLLLAYEIARITQQLLDQAVAHYEDVKEKFSAGTASRFDVLQSKVQVTKVMPEMIRAKNAIRLTMADLNRELGRGVYSSLRIRGGLFYDPIDIREETFLVQAYLHKPEMILRLLGIDISRWAIQAAKAGYRPRIDLNADYYYRSDRYGDLFNKNHNNWSAGISVSIPIFDGFSSRAKVLEAKARYAQAQLSKEDAADEVALLIRRDCLDLREAQAIIDSQKDSVEEAREALRLAIVGFDNGVRTNLDVLDAQVSLAQIEQTLAEGTYDYMMAKSALDRDMGRLVVQDKDDGSSPAGKAAEHKVVVPAAGGI